MKIKSIHIENFGKLSNLNLDFNENLTQICRQNGWGKSTLSFFLKAMFYGMAQKGRNKEYNSERSKFKPWQGGIYGGSLVFSVKEKEYRVTRTFSDTPEGDTFELVELMSGLKSKDFTKDLGQELFGVGVETFEITAFFPQMAFESGITDEMRANMTGLNKYENDLQNLTMAQKKLAVRMRELKSGKPKQSELDAIRKGCGDGQRLIASLEREKDELERSLIVSSQELEKKKAQISALKIEQEKYRKTKAEKEEKSKEIFALQSSLTSLLSQQNEISPVPAENVVAKSQRNIWPVLFPFLSGGLVAALILLGIFNVFSFSVTLAISILFFVFSCIFEIYLVKQQKLKNKNCDTTPQKESHDNLNKENENKILEIKKFIDELNAGLQNIVIPNFDEDEFDSQKNKCFTLEKEVAILSQKLFGKNRELENAIDRQEKLEEEFEEMTRRKDEFSNKIFILENTIEFLKKAQENVSVRFSKPFKEAFNKVFETVAGEKKDKISVDINMKVTESSQSGEKEFEFLSQGYRDAISICQRLALLDTIYLNEKPFILLDDPLVNLDEDKVNVMTKILKDFSENYQTIYLYCHERNEIKYRQ